MNIEKAVRSAVVHAPVDSRERLAAALVDSQSLLPQGDFRAVAPNITGSGGSAFQWADIIGIEDITGVLGGSLAEMDPLEAAKLVLAMLGLWKRLRSMREDLNEKEYMVLRAVRGGARKVEAISSETSLGAEEVARVSNELMRRLYLDRVPLLERDSDGYFTTF